LAQKLAHATFNYLRALDPIASPKDFGPGDRFVLPEEWIASQVHFDRLQIADEAFFIGFPGFDGRMWFEEAAVLPSRAPRRWPRSRACLSQTPTFEPPMSSWWRVYRLAGLAAVSLSTADKEFRPVVTVDPQHVPSLVIGVMSGHFSEPAPEQPASLRHGGLSYLTRSTSLHEVIQSARNLGFRR